MLTGQAKKNYQREYMKAYMKSWRGVKTSASNVKTPVKTHASSVKTQIKPVQWYTCELTEGAGCGKPLNERGANGCAECSIYQRVKPTSNLDELDPVPCLTQELQKEIAFSVDVKTHELDPVQPIPLYNPQIHRAGDRVMVQKGKRLIETVIPELDADGYAVYEEG